MILCSNDLLATIAVAAALATALALRHGSVKPNCRSHVTARCVMQISTIYATVKALAHERQAQVTLQ